MKILRDSYIPIHQQLEDLLLHEMRTDNLKPGDRFYSEFEITKKYAVSRSTVRNVVVALFLLGQCICLPLLSSKAAAQTRVTITFAACGAACGIFMFSAVWISSIS